MIYISLEISVTDIVHTQYLGNILVPRRLLSAGYQPWEGNAGGAVGVRCWNSEIQPSSSRPPDEDTNPLGQLLKGHFFLCICHLRPDKTCQKIINPCPAAILLQDGPDFTWYGWVWGIVMASNCMWASGACLHLLSLLNKPWLSAYPEQGPSPRTSTLMGAGCHQSGWAVEWSGFCSLPCSSCPKHGREDCATHICG